MSILKDRLQTWIDKNNILPIKQTAFRKKMGCTDHIPILNSLINYTRSQGGKSMLTPFTDLSKAFDSINHWKLWEKLYAMGAPIYLVDNIKFLL